LGREQVAEHVVDALKRLEYRGYDSAGVATLEAGKLKRCRAEGKLQNLEARLTRET
jgi:glucosamine--fructose-6-phosphate aminotransferase (isomerizing)